jgi:hypothetical protein
VDLYEHALGALALAVEAVQGGMSAREAAERYDVPRGALGSLANGSKNAISEPPPLSPPGSAQNEGEEGFASPRDAPSDEHSTPAARDDLGNTEDVTAAAGPVDEAPRLAEEINPKRTPACIEATSTTLEEITPPAAAPVPEVAPAPPVADLPPSQIAQRISALKWEQGLAEEAAERARLVPVGSPQGDRVGEHIILNDGLDIPAFLRRSA